MKLTRTLITFALALLPTIIMAQPTVNNCEQFTIGTVLKFQECDTTGISAGSSGASQTWNFASLISIPDTSTEWMVAPDSTSHGSSYPTSNLVEKYSNGTFVYVDKTTDSNYQVGYVDTVNNYIVSYPNSILFALRPITYGDVINDSFSITFASSSLNFTGLGLCTISADAYGTLILPNGTYNNVLRIKIAQAQIDTLSSSSVTFNSTTVSYVWFDGIHTSALLKIDSSNYAGSISTDVEYLINESNTGIKQANKQEAFKIYPNPSSGQFNFATTDKGVLRITDQLGRPIETISISENATSVSTTDLSSGVYYATFQTGTYMQTQKLIVEH